MKHLLLISLLLAATLPCYAKIQRTVEKTFPLPAEGSVKVNISGGSINVVIGDTDRVEVELTQTFRTNSESEADEISEQYDIILEQRGQEIKIAATHDKSGRWWKNSNHRGSGFSARLTVPAYAKLDLDTSGGSIKIRGETSSDIRANTSGGSIDITGSSGDLHLDTSGGSISVEKALGKIHVDTSGGSITIRYVGPGSAGVHADTSGGGIHIGLDQSGAYDIVADTSGGSVRIEGLNFKATKQDRTHAEGTVNGGGVKVYADTSGGGIVIRGATK